MCDSGCSGPSAAGMGENGQEYLAHHNAQGAFSGHYIFSSRSWPGSLYNHNNHFTLSRTPTPIVSQLLNDMKQNFFCNDDAGWGWGQPSSDCSESGFSSFMTCPLPPMSELTSRFNSTLKIIPRKSFMMMLCYCPFPPMSKLTSKSRR